MRYGSSLALAEELHFGRTADRAHLTPARVSQIIRDLEVKVGGQLVYRTSRRVQLTARRARFREEVGGLHAQLMGALERTSEDGSGFTGVFRLGLLTPVIGGPHLPAITRAFERRRALWRRIRMPPPG